MYYQLDKDYANGSPCTGDSGNQCLCKDPSQEITIINPLYMKLLWKDTSHEMMAHYAVDVFKEVKRMMDEPFTEAVKAHLVGASLMEAFLFRIQMQVGAVFRTAVSNFISKGYTVRQIARSLDTTNVVDCGLAIYGISGCPFKPYNSLINVMHRSDINITNYPYIDTLLVASNRISILNSTYGLPRWLGIANYFNYIVFNADVGYTSVTDFELNIIYDEMVDELATSYFNTSAYTADQLLGTQRIVNEVARIIGVVFLKPYSIDKTFLQSLCLYQYGYITHNKFTTYNLTLALARTVVDIASSISTNPNSVYKDTNGPAWYNMYTHYKYVYSAQDSFKIECTSYADSIYDATVAKPAGFWGQVFRIETPFHDDFVIRYLNRFRDPLFAHNFTVGNWSELGLAQWGGGFVTYALVEVRAMNEIVRTGMWKLVGSDNYYNKFVEYSSWSIKQGYPQAYIYSIDEARLLLDTLARQDQQGQDFRRHVLYTGSTFIGDGVNYVNGVGNVGEITFTPEANLGNFSCHDSPNAAACDLLDTNYASSGKLCLQVEAMYTTCYNQYRFVEIAWVDGDNCKNFETTMTYSEGGIPCTLDNLYGNAHPYVKSRGNIVYLMMYTLTIDLQLSDNLWCDGSKTCDFTRGGMFTTTTVDKLFGVVLVLPTGERKLLLYDTTPMDEYFAPEFIMTLEGTLIWPYSSNSSVVTDAQEYILTHALNETLVIYNPTYATYPAWTSSDVEFNKFYQCQKRTLFGPPDLFVNCYDILYTGRDELNKTLDIHQLHGNDTLSYFSGNDSKGSLGVSGSTANNQYISYQYEGFQAYPYKYLTLSGGVDYEHAQTASLFSKQHALQLLLSQSSLIFGFQKEIPLTVPVSTPYWARLVALTGLNRPTKSLPTRRFVENKLTWDKLRVLGTARDSYGMAYKTPLGMSSLHRMTDFPVFADTPHSYGNEEWGGLEYAFISGYKQNEFEQRTFIDYDPVTGRALRQALRQQINIHVEANAMFPLLFSSQSRCAAPSNTYNLGSGYGCFAFVPVLWFEDARIVDNEKFFQTYDHFYARPSRANVIGLIGIAVGVIFIVFGTCLYISESYHKRRFHQRAYLNSLNKCSVGDSKTANSQFLHVPSTSTAEGTAGNSASNKSDILSSMSVEMCLTLAKTLGAQNPTLFTAMTDTLMKVLVVLPPLSLSESNSSVDAENVASRSDVLNSTLTSIQSFAVETLSSDSVTGS
eukprot:gene28799-35723_t